ncbi:hypothetical protein NDU88_004760 [Pleurodeles waltl]|uniref:Uncharacterized protein n=1 Tax=Pleurodeles waltl TaxID=8319 RepID=A0AAV7NKH2_PLEWA|nr:hypothetical protein NDU88_004760 [Pleurodeles waltl]
MDVVPSTWRLTLRFIEKQEQTSVRRCKSSKMATHGRPRCFGIRKVSSEILTGIAPQCEERRAHPRKCQCPSTVLRRPRDVGPKRVDISLAGSRD